MSTSDADTRAQVYNMFHRQDMHAMLLESAMSEEGEGEPRVQCANQ